jgi:hypothetical protein
MLGIDSLIGSNYLNQRSTHSRFIFDKDVLTVPFTYLADIVTYEISFGQLTTQHSFPFVLCAEQDKYQRLDHLA